MTTYAELTQQILDYTETSTDVLTSTITNDFIEHTENRILKEADLDVFKSHQSANTIYVAPTPDLAYNVELGITRLPTRLSTSNTTSWLGNNAPMALLYGCLAEAFKFLKGPAEMLQLYEQSYQRAMQELIVEQTGRHRRDEYMHGELKFPMQSVKTNTRGE
jgi:hypothetical protein